jgi:lipopolysaccharide export system permease protein
MFSVKLRGRGVSDRLWRLSQVDESDLTDPKQITGSQTVTGTWKTNLTPEAYPA